MRRFLPLTAIVAVIVLAACSGQPPEPDATVETPQDSQAMAAGPPDDDIHRGVAPRSAMGGATAMNREITLDESIRAAWTGIRVRVVERDTGAGSTFDVDLGADLRLGDSGLVLTAHDFVPDFVMDDNGITSRSADPANPAARVTLSEAGREPYTGWLFAAMPEIHPFPHERYRVVLVQGLAHE